MKYANNGLWWSFMAGNKICSLQVFDEYPSDDQLIDAYSKHKDRLPDSELVVFDLRDQKNGDRKVRSVSMQEIKEYLELQRSLYQEVSEEQIEHNKQTVEQIETLGRGLGIPDFQVTPIVAEHIPYLLSVTIQFNRNSATGTLEEIVAALTAARDGADMLQVCRERNLLRVEFSVPPWKR